METKCCDMIRDIFLNIHALFGFIFALYGFLKTKTNGFNCELS
uniref:Uncharacterized protein n=1 Tax=viral metagenome TaxID=1070528 RepID=A0A6C0CAY2_9ZZZZ